MFVPAEQLRAGVTRTWLVLGGLGVVLLLLALVVADRLARSLTRPVTDLAATAHRLGSGDLTARATPAGPARGARRRRRRSTGWPAGSASCWPPSGRAPPTSPTGCARPSPRCAWTSRRSRRRDRERLLDDVDAVGRGIDEVISEARRHASARGWAPGATRRRSSASGCSSGRCWPTRSGGAVTVDLAGGPLPVRVAAADLGAAVDALLGNVFAHTPEGTAFGVAVRRRAGGGAEVTVVRRGPGHRARGGRARAAAAAARPASGLDIARRTAEASGGRLRIDSSAAGTSVTLELGPPG